MVTTLLVIFYCLQRKRKALFLTMAFGQWWLYQVEFQTDNIRKGQNIKCWDDSHITQIL